MIFERRWALGVPLLVSALQGACGHSGDRATPQGTEQGAIPPVVDPGPAQPPGITDFGTVSLSTLTPQAPVSDAAGNAFALSIDGHLLASSGKYHWDSRTKRSRLLLRANARLAAEAEDGGFRSKKLLPCGEDVTLVTDIDVNTLTSSGWDPKEARIWLATGGKEVEVGRFRKPAPGATEDQKIGTYWHPELCDGAYAAVCSLTFSAGPLTDAYGDTYVAKTALRLASGETLYVTATPGDGTDPYAHTQVCANQRSGGL